MTLTTKKIERIKEQLQRYLTDNYDSMEFDDYVNEEDVQFLLETLSILRAKNELLLRTLNLVDQSLAHMDSPVAEETRKYIKEIVNDLR